MSRIAYSVKNARVALLFNLAMLILNFFSRRIFIDNLGEELVGLSASVISYIGFLNLADMGISAAIVNALYRPLFKEDRSEIRDIVSLFGLLFRWVGIFILGSGVVLIALIPVLFSKSIAGGLDPGLIYATFITFLITTLLSYLVNYKQNLLVASQKGYIVTRVFNLSLIAKILIQMALLLWSGGGYIAWLAVELTFGGIFSLWLSLAVRRECPWLDSSVRHGRTVIKKYAEVFRNIRRAFAHRVAGVVLIQSDVIVLQLMVSLPMVTMFTSYTMISDRIVRLITGSLNNSYASVGNLVAEGDKSKIKLVFWEFNAMYFWLGGVVAFGFYRLIDPFIGLWLGEEMLLPVGSAALLAGVLFISFVRQTAQYFLNAYGLFQDVWAAWTEAGLNLLISVAACYYWGVIGVVFGTVVSTGLNVFLWKPYFLYRNGFRETSREYWLTISKHLGVLVGVGFSLKWLFSLGWMPSAGEHWSGWVVNALVQTFLFALLAGIVMHAGSSGMRALVKLWLDLLGGFFGRLRGRLFCK